MMESEREKDKKRVAVLLQKTHGGQGLSTAEYNIVMAYWRGQKSQKELFDRVYERAVGEADFAGTEGIYRRREER